MVGFINDVVWMKIFCCFVGWKVGVFVWWLLGIGYIGG